ncbi:hypothetical protein [Streptomyces viridosporus]|uniref:hypothetical protein n=1 Tax=Streptomyces viridosporus TaxID=67581 RepID=UPI00117CB499|nr:hypothetical protein [Streptomyces viridosporus]
MTGRRSVADTSVLTGASRPGTRTPSRDTSGPSPSATGAASTVEDNWLGVSWMKGTSQSEGQLLACSSAGETTVASLTKNPYTVLRSALR